MRIHLQVDAPRLPVGQQLIQDSIQATHGDVLDMVELRTSLELMESVCVRVEEGAEGRFLRHVDVRNTIFGSKSDVHGVPPTVARALTGAIARSSLHRFERDDLALEAVAAEPCAVLSDVRADVKHRVHLQDGEEPVKLEAEKALRHDGLYSTAATTLRTSKP